ncbi:hypothetical protein C7C56_013360 [Massilia glaciei]|uniref:Uncharacterized protein n=2 Tax=Massilia glaciei TaxID=1524097 RepID=A0A2U2HJZ1_9BURK|nr:hypothetical protein C7C56_013360 [Massilia glaciei]
MSRISMTALADAIVMIRAMNIAQKEILAGELSRVQPNMLASVVVLPRMGVSLSKMEVPIEMLLICFQAMKQAGLNWPLITEAEQEKQLGRYIAAVRVGEDMGRLGPGQNTRAMKKYLITFPEKPLLAFVTTELSKWLAGVAPEETDSHIMLSIVNLVNCIAFVPMPRAGK